MRRRDISKAIIGIAATAGAVASARKAQAQTCSTPPCYSLTTGETAALVTNYGYPPGDVRRYGADPTNVADSTSAFASSFTVFSNGGPATIVVAGTYSIASGPLNVPQHLILDLSRATLKFSGSSTSGFSLTNTCGIVNGYLDFSSLTGVGILASNVQQLLFRDLYITGGSNDCMQLPDCYTYVLDNVFFSRGSARAFYASTTISLSPVNSIWLRSVEVAGFTSPPGTDLVRIESAAGVWIEDGNFENNASGTNDIHIMGNTHGGVSQCTVTGCYFESGTGGANIYLGGSSSTSCSGIRITDCFVLVHSGVTRYPVFVDQNVQNDLLITGNTFLLGSGGASAAVTLAAAVTNYVPNVYNNGGNATDIARTFTPQLYFGSGSTGMSGTFIGSYIRQNNIITVSYSITLTAVGSSTGQATIAVPIIANAAAVENGAVISYAENMNGLQGTLIARCGNPGGQVMYLYDTNSSGNVGLSNSNFTNASMILGSITYQV